MTPIAKECLRITAVSALAVLALAVGPVHGQDFSGAYVIPTSNGQISLRIAQDASGKIEGVLTDDQGTEYKLEAALDEGTLSGTIRNQNGMAAIGAALERDQLNVYLIPFDAANEPMYDAAQEFVMEREDDAVAQDGQPSIRLNVPGSPGAAHTNPGSEAGPEFSGTFTGSLNGMQASLTLAQEGSSVQGEMVGSDGYRYTLEGTTSGSGVRGIFADPQMGGRLEFEASLRGGGLDFALLVPDPNTGQVQRIPVQFTRGAAGHAVASPQARAVETENVERDPALVGSWTHSDTQTDPTFSLTTQVNLHVRPDGTYLHGNGRVIGGGSNAWGSSSVDSGQSGDYTVGKWRTENSIIYIMEGSSTQWVPYARYYIEGGKMLFTFGDGSRQLWYRQ